MEDTKILRTAIRLLKKNMGIKPGEKVSIITDTEMFRTARIFQIACAAIDDIEPVVVIIPPATHRGQEPPVQVQKLMIDSDVAILVTRFSISHTHARLNATEAGTRMASMGNVTPDIFNSALAADYDLVASRARKISTYLDKASTVTIRNESGTDLKMSLEGRRTPPPDDGLYTKQGQWGNLPAGEAFIAPIETSLEGILVVDSTAAPLGLVKEPVTLHIKDGKIFKIEGGKEATELKNFYERIEDPNAYVVAELGIGTNDRARITGKIIEDEKKFGTVHIGFGMNVDFGGRNESKTHNDYLILNPCLKIDDFQLINTGEYTIDIE